MFQSEMATNCAIASCVNTLISKHKFPTLEHVELSLSSQNFSRNYVNVPAFHYLLEINQKIHIFVCSFLASRPIVTLLDLEEELCAFLHSLCIPSFAESFSCTPDNPEEIEIDKDTCDKKQNFEWFGLGHLINFPPVLKLFRIISKQPLREADILRMFNSFEGTEVEFELHLRQKYSVNDICAELNVSIDPNGLKQHKLALNHIGIAQNQKRISENFLPPEPSKRQKKTTVYKSQRLKSPDAKTQVGALLSKCTKILDSSYPPSFTKLHNIVIKLDLSWEGCSEVITEYLMLHLGSSKYRQRQFEPAENPIVIEKESIRAETENISNDTQASLSSGSSTSHVVDVVERSMPHLSTVEMISVVPNSELAGLCPFSASVDTRNIESIGRWGESLVYQYLLNKYPEADVCWMNKEKESLAAYDLKLMCKGENNLQATRFIEVKTTRFSNKNVFELSFNEFSFMSGQGGKINFDIYRVYNAGDSSRVSITVVRDAYIKLKNHGLKLCLAI